MTLAPTAYHIEVEHSTNTPNPLEHTYLFTLDNIH